MPETKNLFTNTTHSIHSGQTGHRPSLFHSISTHSVHRPIVGIACPNGPILHSVHNGPSLSLWPLVSIVGLTCPVLMDP